LKEALIPLQLDRDKAKFLAQRMAPGAMTDADSDHTLDDVE
jgi:hypothetical protein